MTIPNNGQYNEQFRISISGNRSAHLRIICLCGDHDTKLPMSFDDLCLISLQVSDWFSLLSPWSAPAVFGSNSFDGKGKQTLDFLTGILLPFLDETLGAKGEYILVGYSLAGLFSLWAGYESDYFSGIAAISPSLWFPKWDSYIITRNIHAKAVYLSLGIQEEKFHHPILSKVGDAVRRQANLFSQAEVINKLEWNPGNHFYDSPGRVIKGINWLSEQLSY